MSPWRHEFRQQLSLALPVVATNLGMMAMGVVDVVMVGHHSTVGAGAIAIGNGYAFLVLSIGLGILLALDPLVSQAAGAGDEPAVARALQRGLFLALLLSVPIGVAFGPVEAVLTWLRQPAEVVPLARDYVHVLIAGVPFFLVFAALRGTLQALHRLRPILIVILLANVLNVALNRVLVFGWDAGAFVVPELGSTGSAWATTCSRVFMAGLLLLVSWPLLGPRLRPLDPRAFRLAPLMRWLRLGLPIAAQMLFEMGAFHAVGVFMGMLGALELAANQYVLSVASVTFMVPLGVSTAASVRVGWNIGRGDVEGARRAARTSLVTGAGFMGVMAALLFLFPEALTALFTEDPAVAVIAVALFPLAAAFQVFDGLQVVANGVLRGTGDTRVPALLNLLAYWAFAIPFGWWLTFRAGHGPQGLWWGLVTGLVAGLLLVRVRVRLAGTIDRVVLEDG